MKLDLDGKRALVTGASKGIGASIAFELASHGCAVAVVARDRDLLETVARRLTADTAGNVCAIVADLSTPDGPERAVVEATSALGGLDILINNAGASPFGSFDVITDEIWQEAFDLKVMGYVRCMRAALDPMRVAGSGRIVNIVGVAGRLPLPGYTLGALNAALLHLTKSIADQVASEGIGVVAVNPGLTETERMQDALALWADQAGVSTEEFSNGYLAANVPAGRFAQPEEIAQVVAFLASDAARYVTGSSVFVDGASLKGF